MLGDCKGEVNLIVTPDFETSATKIEKMYIQIKQVTDDGIKSKLQDEVKKLGKEKGTLDQENKNLQGQIENLKVKIYSLTFYKDFCYYQVSLE